MTAFCMTYNVKDIEELNKARKQFLDTEKFTKITNVVQGRSLANPSEFSLEIYYEDGRKNEGIWRDEMMGDIPKGSLNNSAFKAAIGRMKA